VADPINDIFARLYATNDRDRAAFGEAWCGPERLAYGEDTLVARYAADGDGRGVEVYCCAMPARFWTLRILPSPSEPSGYDLTTGSDHRTAARAARMSARMIAEGMIAVQPLPEVAARALAETAPKGDGR
jgi:hypothetical protein